MSSAAYITPAEPVADSLWAGFCAAHRLEHSPRTIGGNVWYWGGLSGVQVVWCPRHIVVSTFFMGPRLQDVARIAALVWCRFGGRLEASEEVAARIAATMSPPQERE